MDAEEVNQSEEQIREVTADTVEHFVQTESLCMNAGDDDMLQWCYREIELLEYLLENPQYDRKIIEEIVQYSEQAEKDIMEADDMRRRLVDIICLFYVLCFNIS